VAEKTNYPGLATSSFDVRGGAYVQNKSKSEELVSPIKNEMSEKKRQARSRSTLIVPVKQGNSPEGPCRGKGGEHHRSLRGA